MNIKILGTGCAKCVTLENKVRELVKEKSIPAEVEKVSDLREIMGYGIMMTPGLVINGKVKSSGYIPKDAEIVEWIREES
jgi:small redox-active disulfide protein 2